MSTVNLLRQLDSLEHDLDAGGHGGGHGQTGPSRWMIPYADLLTLLLGFFIVLFSLSIMDKQTLEGYRLKLQDSLNSTSKTLALKEQELANIRTQLEQTVELMPEPAVSEPLEATAVAAEPLETIEEAIIRQLEVSGGVQVTQQPYGVVISFMDNVLFKPGQATIQSRAKPTLTRLADILRPLQHPIRIEGHTDDTPIKTAQYPSNWELSTARATNVVRSLVTQHGLDATRLSAVGYGEHRPIANNSSIEGKQKNRRVDIVILNRTSAAQEPVAAEAAVLPQVEEDTVSTPRQ